MLPEDIKIVKFVSRRARFCFSMTEREIKYMDVTVCLDGAMIYYIDGKRIELHGGDAIVISPGSRRMRQRTDEALRYVSFNVEICGEYREPAQKISGCVKKSTEIHFERFASIWRSKSPLKEIKCKHLFSFIYYDLIDTYVDTTNSHVKKIKRYISEHLASCISLSALAAAVHLAPEYLCALFKHHTGETIFEFINRERIEEAKQRMLSDDSSLLEIAASCGFPNYNYFSTTFKRLVGVTPSRYRKNAK